MGSGPAPLLDTLISAPPLDLGHPQTGLLRPPFYLLGLSDLACQFSPLDGPPVPQGLGPFSWPGSLTPFALPGSWMPMQSTSYGSGQ